MAFKRIEPPQFTKPSQGLTITSTERPEAPSIRPLAIKRTRLLLGCYRISEAYDPEVYSAAVAAMLSAYSDSVIMAVTDPVTGLASKYKFLPTLSEIKEACDFKVELYASEAGRLERHRQEQIENHRPKPQWTQADEDHARKMEDRVAKMVADFHKSNHEILLKERAQPTRDPRIQAFLDEQREKELAADPELRARVEEMAGSRAEHEAMLDRMALDLAPDPDDGSRP